MKGAVIMLLGERIREARLLKKLTQKQLAKLLNVTDATINRYERGLRNPDPEMLKAIADILDVSIDYLLGKIDISNRSEIFVSEFSKRLKELREEASLTQKDIAEALGIDRTTYTKYETGKSEPDFETTSKIADYFNVSVDYLLGKSDIRNPSDEITKAVSDDPELAEFWNELKDREELKLLFKQTKKLSPKAIGQVMRIIKAIEDEES
jgi:transcriptional regulator with XRE-family HTH domain